jgi:PAS domain-containing protein/CheY-like chemotaxis protein
LRDGASPQRVLRGRAAPALLVTNLVLPQVDGFMLLTELRKKVPVSQTPALVVSSSMQLRTTASGLRQQLGIREIVASGMVSASLRAAVQRALSPQRSAASNERAGTARASEVRPGPTVHDAARTSTSLPTQEDEEVWPTLPPREPATRAKQSTGSFAAPPVLPSSGGPRAGQTAAVPRPSLPDRGEAQARDSQGRPSLPTREGRVPPTATSTLPTHSQTPQPSAQRPAQLTQTGAQRPAQLTKTGAQRPSQLTQTGANRAVQASGAASTRPERGVPPPRTLDPRRLAAIESMKLLHEPGAESALQRLVEETARTLGAPIALVSLVLEKQQWFKAHVGLTDELLAQRGTPLAQSFCRHVVDDDAASPLIVPDAKRHPYFAQNLLVRRGDVGSYAGAPLLTSSGQVLGTLCILDKRPRAMTQEQVDQLQALARRAAGELELHGALATGTLARAAPAAPLEDVASSYLEPVLAQLEAGIMLIDAERKIRYANPAMCALVSLPTGELTGWTQLSLMHRLAAFSEFPDDLLRQVRLHPEGPFVLRAELSLDVPTRRVLRYLAKPIRLPQGIVQLGVCTDVTAEVAQRTQRDAPVMFVEEADG